MIGFDKFSENGFIKESLDSPIEFYMTDDTKMPKEIFAAIDHDGTSYGMSLILSDYDGVYILDFYRIVNVKKRFWSFFKPNHIRPMLSTVIKFMEACYPFVMVKMKGILIVIPGKTGSEKYVPLLGRILKRSYIKQFREVPIIKTSDKAKNYLFLVKKSVEPTSLFKSAAFHKNFQFDGKKMPEFTSDMMDDAKEYYKFIKPNVSMKASDKFAFGKIKVELSAEDETVYMLDNASLKYKAEKENPKPKNANLIPEKDYVVSINVNSAKDLLLKALDGGSKSYISGAGYFDNASDSLFTLSLPHIMAIILPSAYEKISKFGYQESKINFNDLSYAAKQGYNNLPTNIRKSLVDEGVFKVNGELNLTPENTSVLKASLASFMYIDAPAINTLKGIIKTKMEPKEKSKLSSGGIEVVEKKLELDKNPVSVLEAFGSSNESSPYSGYLGFEETNEDVAAKKTAVLSMKEVSTWYNEFGDKSNNVEQYNLKLYTGSAAYDINSYLRSMISSKNLSLKSIYSYKPSSGGMEVSTEILMRYFDKAPRLENGIWVYRNADTPDVKKYEVGDDYIDAGFLSTTVSSGFSLSSGGNTRLKIYVPSGTKMFPIFGKSEVPSEDEIVFPPMSVLRITETYDGINNNENKRMFVCTMIGSGYQDFLKAMENELILEQANKKIPKKDIDPSLKWGAPTSSYEDSKLISKMVKDGKIKIKIS
jgi:hypothetical protein